MLPESDRHNAKLCVQCWRTVTSCSLLKLCQGSQKYILKSELKLHMLSFSFTRLDHTRVVWIVNLTSAVAARRLLFESTKSTALKTPPMPVIGFFCFFVFLFFVLYLAKPRVLPKEKIACSCGKLRSKRSKQSFGCIIRVAAAGYWLAFWKKRNAQKKKQKAPTFHG